MLNNLNQKAFTLVEMLVALAVSSIMIMATYASYDIVAQQFKKNKDIAELHTSGRAILRMVERDIRMAGFSFRDRDANLVFGEILDKDALKLTDSGTDACCDSITVQYDYYDEEYKTVERQEIIYDSSKYKDRYRLYKRINILGKDGGLYTTKKIGKREVMADFIEDFQLVNVENANNLYVMSNGSNEINIIDLVAKKRVGRFNAGRPYHYPALTTGTDGLLYVMSNGSNEINIIDPVTKKRVGRFNAGRRYHYPALEFRLRRAGQEALVKIHLVIRSRKEHSKVDKIYAKKSYDIGNYKLTKRDKYKHDSFSSTVLARNLVL